VAIARNIGYPVMIKASAGGGGKGMRIARDDQAVRDGFRSSSNEARSSFGDDRVFIEKFVDEPRHIEIQIIADGHGNCIYLGERECSIQRRHQKVIEEAPSPFLDEKTRRAMGEQAVALAKAVNYRSAGTVEFIVDAGRNFYFLEMNTRLQVEHPVTELVTGHDLVELMIRIAAGEKLPFKQASVKLRGWAIEARIYAEDPERGFLPSIGRLIRYREPVTGAHVRVDSGVYEGGEISMYYDPMIAKLIAHGEDRDSAIASMREALDSFYVRGLANNIGFLQALMAHLRFHDARLTTGFIAEEFPGGFAGVEITEEVRAQMVAVAAIVHQAYARRASSANPHFRTRAPVANGTWMVRLAGANHSVSIVETSVGHAVIEGRRSRELVSDWKLGEPIFRGRIDGKSIVVQVDRVGVGYRLSTGGVRLKVAIYSPRAAELARHMIEKAAPDLSKFLVSPMPGLLVSLLAKEGEVVKPGQELAVIEAMKMENQLRAEREGRILKLHAKPGDSLSVDQIILEFE